MDHVGVETGNDGPQREIRDGRCGEAAVARDSERGDLVHIDAFDAGVSTDPCGLRRWGDYEDVVAGVASVVGRSSGCVRYAVDVGWIGLGDDTNPHVFNVCGARFRVSQIDVKDE